MNIVVIGASGFLGSTIYKDLMLKDSDGLFVGTYRYNRIDNAHVKVDVLDAAELSQFLSKTNPDIIIWSIYDLQKEEKLTEIGLNNLLKNISKTTKIVYISTTIAAGPNQSETIEPVYRTEDMYICKYVNGKINGEKLIRTHKNHIIVRPGSIYGIDGYNRVDIRTKIIREKIKNKISYIRAENLLTSFVNVHDLSQAIFELIELDFTGTINIAGDIPISHYYFSKKRAEHLGLDTSYITAEKKKAAYKYSLDITKQKELLKTNIRNL